MPTVVDYVLCVCRQLFPRFVADNAFDGIDLSRVQLIVPAQSRKEYRKAQGWRHFFGKQEVANVCRPEQILVPSTTHT